MWLPPDQRDGTKITTDDPKVYDAVTYPLVCLVFSVPNETHQITDANVARPLIKTTLAC